MLKQFTLSHNVNCRYPLSDPAPCVHRWEGAAEQWCFRSGGFFEAMVSLKQWFLLSDCIFALHLSTQDLDSCADSRNP